MGTIKSTKNQINQYLVTSDKQNNKSHKKQFSILFYLIIVELGISSSSVPSLCMENRAGNHAPPRYPVCCHQSCLDPRVETHCHSLSPQSFSTFLKVFLSYVSLLVPMSGQLVGGSCCPSIRNLTNSLMSAKDKMTV